MALTAYTSYDEVRAVLGVEADELRDETLALPLYEAMLASDLDGISLDIRDDYVTVAAIDEGTRTEAQQNFYLASRAFSAYAVAKVLAPSLPLLVQKDVTDGKAGIGRFAGTPYLDTLKGVVAGYDQTRETLRTRYAEVNVSAVITAGETFSLFAISSPGSDRVLGT